MLVSSEACATCRKLAETTFADPAVIAAARRDFVTLRLEAKRHRQWVEALNLQAFPSTIFAAPDGTILHAVTGFAGSSAMLDHFREALVRLRKHRERATGNSDAPPSIERGSASIKPSTAATRSSAPPDPLAVWTASPPALWYPAYPSLYTPPAYWGSPASYPSYSAGTRSC